MKKLFHLGMIASIVLIVSSCSKSASDLAANENAVQTGITKLNPGKYPFSPIFSSNLTKFYPKINQPEEMELGDNGAAISSGQIAVFYVLLSPDIASERLTSATLTTIDDATGLPIQSYNLISYRDVGSVDAMVPDELVGTPFMVALVYLDSQYIDKTITLSSYMEFNGTFAMAQLERAFTVTP